MRVGGIEGEPGAKLFSKRESFRNQIRGDHTGAGEVKQASEHQSNRPLARDENRVTFEKRKHPDRFEDGVDRFQHGTFQKGIPPGYFYDAGKDEIHHANISGKAASGRFEPRCDPCFFVNGTLGEGAVPAGVAFEAGNVMMECDPVADTKIADAISDFDNCPGRFVPKNSGRRNSAILDLFDIGGTDSAGGDFDEQFPRGDFRNWQCLDIDLVDAAIDRRAHCPRDHHQIAVP